MAITKTAQTQVMTSTSIAAGSSAYASVYDVSDAIAVSVGIKLLTLSVTPVGTLTVDVFGIDSAGLTSENLSLYTGVFSDPAEPWFIVFELETLAVHGVHLRLRNDTDLTLEFDAWMSKTII